MANLKNTTVNNNGAVQLPVGNTSQRTGSPQNGMIRYNTSTGELETYNNQWKRLFTNDTVLGVAQMDMVNSGSVDNSGSITQRSIFSGSPNINTGGFDFDSAGITVPADGLYLVFVNCRYNGDSGERNNTGIRFVINTDKGPISRSAYNRNTTHAESSTNLSCIFSLRENDRVELGFFDSAGTGTQSLRGNESHMLIMRINQPCIVTELVNSSQVNDFNSPTRVNIFNTNPLINTGDYIVESAGIRVPEAGIYEIYAHIDYTRGIDRDAPAFRFFINGSDQGYTSASAYMRGDDNHIEASSNMKAFFVLNSNDRLELAFFREGASGNASSNGSNSIVYVRKVG